MKVISLEIDSQSDFVMGVAHKEDVVGVVGQGEQVSDNQTVAYGILVTLGRGKVHSSVHNDSPDPVLQTHAPGCSRSGERYIVNDCINARERGIHWAKNEVAEAANTAEAVLRGSHLEELRKLCERRT